MDYQDMKADLLERLYVLSAWIMEKPLSFDKEQFALLPVFLNFFFEHENDAARCESPGNAGSLPEMTN